jgi:hypothetical protein
MTEALQMRRSGDIVIIKTFTNTTTNPNLIGLNNKTLTFIAEALQMRRSGKIPTIDVE